MTKKQTTKKPRPFASVKQLVVEDGPTGFFYVHSVKQLVVEDGPTGFFYVHLGDCCLSDSPCRESWKAHELAGLINVAVEAWHEERCAGCPHVMGRERLREAVVGRLDGILRAAKPKSKRDVKNEALLDRLFPPNRKPIVPPSTHNLEQTAKYLLDSLPPVERKIVEQRFGIEPKDGAKSKKEAKP